MIVFLFLYEYVILSQQDESIPSQGLLGTNATGFMLSSYLIILTLGLCPANLTIVWESMAQFIEQTLLKVQTHSTPLMTWL